MTRYDVGLLAFANAFNRERKYDALGPKRAFPSSCGYVWFAGSAEFPQHFLNFTPLPHGQGSFLPTLVMLCEGSSRIQSRQKLTSAHDRGSSRSEGVQVLRFPVPFRRLRLVARGALSDSATLNK